MGLTKLCVFYQNVRDLRTKQLHFLVSLTHSPYDINALTEIGLNDNLTSEYFSNGWTIYWADRDYTGKVKRSGGSLLAKLQAVLLKHIHHIYSPNYF